MAIDLPLAADRQQRDPRIRSQISLDLRSEARVIVAHRDLQTGCPQI
jgi:hypothetical protein